MVVRHDPAPRPSPENLSDAWGHAVRVMGDDGQMLDRAGFEPYLSPRRGPRAGTTLSAQDAVRQIPEGARVFVEGGSVTPLALLEALDDERARWSRLELVLPYLMARPAPFEHPGEPFWFVTTQASPAYKHLWATGTVSVLPCKYSDTSLIFRPDGPLPCQVALVSVSTPGPEGRFSLGLSTGTHADVIRTADLVIAQVNDKVPYTFGVSELEAEDIDILVRHDAPIIESRPAGTSDEVGRSIARRAAAYVSDGSTIQFGLGALPDAILEDLHDRTGLSVHSGMLSEACVDLFEAGAVEGSMVTAELVSTPRLSAWVDRNPAVVMAPAAYTHGPGVLASLERFVALNSTVEIALDGACNSEVVGDTRISGPGGAPDYAFGAGAAVGGRSVLALRSTAGRGAISRIVRSLTDGAPTTIPGYLADVVVTEHGAAEVRGLPLDARSAALAAIADPAHRAALGA